MAVIRGTNSSNNITGTAGRDYIYGLLSNDRIDGGDGDDRISGNAGNDTLYGGLGDDALRGGKGSDVLSAGDGNDVVDGGRDLVRDTLLGGAGEDELVAYAGDSADGGTGSDTLLLGLQPDFDAPSTLYAVDLSKIHGSTAVDTGYDGVTARYVENAYVSLYNAEAGSSVVGSIGDDQIFVDISFDTAGTVGASLRGGAGDDTVTGSRLNDTIAGDAGTDEIYGGAGNDFLFGGADADLFVIQLEDQFPGAPAQKVDTIRDWSSSDFFLVKEEIFTSPYRPSFEDADQLNPLVANGAPVVSSTVGGQFLYDTDSGRLSYDPDGVGGAGAIQLFNIAGAPALTASDFIFDL